MASGKEKLERYLTKYIYEDRRRWAFCFRVYTLSLNMTASQRVEGCFGRLKAILARRASLVVLANTIQDMVLWRIDFSKEEGKDQRRLQPLMSRLKDSQAFREMFEQLPGKVTTFCQRFIDDEVRNCTFYDVTDYDPEVALPVSSDSEAASSYTESSEDDGGTASQPHGDMGASGGAAAVAGDSDDGEQAATEEEAVLQKQKAGDIASFSGDGSRVPPAVLRAAFDSFGKAYVVTPKDGRRGNIVCIAAGGTHVCTCTLTFRVGMPCRHFFACRFAHAGDVPLRIFDIVHPRWLRHISAACEAAKVAGVAAGQEQSAAAPNGKLWLPAHL